MPTKLILLFKYLKANRTMFFSIKITISLFKIFKNKFHKQKVYQISRKIKSRKQTIDFFLSKGHLNLVLK